MSIAPAFVIEQPVGSLAIHDLTLGVAREDAPVIVAVHGITANGLSWRRVADEVGRRHGPGSIRFLAPDLRGRGGSRRVPAPYGLAAHVKDLTSIASVFGAAPLLVGHSMGAFVAALALATHPERFSAAVLVDGGLAFPAPPDLDIDAALTAVIGPAMDRLAMRFDGLEDYLAFWEHHPSLGPALRGAAGDAVREYLSHDLVEDEAGSGRWRSSCVLEAVRVDGADVLADPVTHGAVRRADDLGRPVELVWAHRGLLNEPQGLYDEGRLAALDLPPGVRVTAVDANHYDVILDEPGVTAVVDAIDRHLGRSG
ncbi:alpha/beta hydrolase [Intrasporangium calvum]|uniref:Alpha/beta hydrolase fold protein n=1 Tax=Intrasporangium calvum (strain ATCC 23552 / DSM 43043 / JCM 3097 / NBRC 12989 / NCIMB 10167 / NRRL B-3866 / 7 KIP) TaxID=710696 RepID=E6SBS1_INTC7|nr:alpha/beta fold hydrolase [Intrasporangium calvum]ADU48430.1 alpha/beta hydrolase fold protein [Intrasporangium calvum DSM 43043]AXG13460.1 alpha/beta hydrolase [Intrasporangium calvum]